MNSLKWISTIFLFRIWEFRPKITINNIKNRSELEEARAQNRRVEIYFDAFIRSKNESIDNI